MAERWIKAGVKNVRAIYTGYDAMKKAGFRYVDSDKKVRYVDALGKLH